MPGLGILVLILALIFVFLIVSYNSLVALRNRVKNAWSQIDVQLKRRHDLIPNLVEVAKKYMEHERETLEAVIKARTQAISVNADDIDARIKAENFLTQTLRSLFAVMERYPNLKADVQMRQLHEELVSTENKIAFARQFYNDEATLYNTKVESFPYNLVASIFGFKPMALFQISEAEREPVKVQF